MHLITDSEHWNYTNFAYMFYENYSFLRTAHMGVHHMYVPQEDCLSVRLQDFCFGVHLLNQGTSGIQILT